MAHRCFGLFLICLLPALIAGQDNAPTGSIVGVVRFTGDVPAPQKIITSDGAVLMHSDLVVDGKTKGLRDVAVYLQGAAPRPLAKDAKPVVMDQRDMIFIPRVIVAQEGQTVRFDNNDLCNHAVQSVSTKTDNLFNVLTPMGQPFDFRFKSQKSPVQIGCPIHQWMRAWVYVFPHPFAAVTDGKGQFKIDKVAAGKHTVMFAHPDTGLRETRSVAVEAGKMTRIDIEWKQLKK
ncbi:MAG: carboxypeptidase regulatory-like domain-containing protein [Gemmataceae bacterium]|nr:carboxypeptidase regulatory-like domain-containing protein [Gemmataceae bacterium]